MFYKQGRSCWRRLEQPIHIRTAHREIYLESLKIKGVGLCDHLGNITQPSTDQFQNKRIHFAFTDEGKPVDGYGGVSPIGGITFSRAKAEFDISRKLIDENCPSQVPLFLFRYPHKKFNSTCGMENLGVVVCGHSSPSYHRASSILRYKEMQSAKEIVDIWAKCLEVNITGNPHWTVEIACKLISQMAKVLRKFHTAGLFRHSAGFGNYSYSQNLGSVFLIDLDSSLLLNSLPVVRQPLEIIRDVASIFYHIQSRFLDKKNLDIFTPTAVNTNALFFLMLKNYYSDISVSQLEYVAAAMAAYYDQAHHNAIVAHQTKRVNVELLDKEKYSYNEYRNISKSDKYWVDMRDTFRFALQNLWSLHEQSELGKQYPFKTSRSSFEQDLNTYVEKHREIHE